jgi:CRP-like cAMP-binding protein
MRDIIWTNIFRKPRDEREQLAGLWQATPLFAGIPAREVLSLADNMHLRSYGKDEVVFREGDQAAGAILVFDGKVEILADTRPLAQLERGDFFGEIALAENDQRTATARCLEDSRLVFFLKQDLEEWIEVEPRLGNRFLMNLSSVLARRLHQANLLLARHCPE